MRFEKKEKPYNKDDKKIYYKEKPKYWTFELTIENILIKFKTKTYWYFCVLIWLLFGFNLNKKVG